MSGGICLIAESMSSLILLKVLGKIDLDWMNAAIGVLHRCAVSR
jgi:hypothetical protein